MKYLVLIVFFNLLSSGHLQEATRVDDHNLVPPDALQTVHTIQGNFYGRTQSNINQKPCSRRSNSESEPLEQPRIKSKVTPSINYKRSENFKPQDLKNEDYNLKAINSQTLFPSPPMTDDKVNDLHEIRKSLSISNPTVDPSEEIKHEVTTSKSHDKLVGRAIQFDSAAGETSQPKGKYVFTPNEEFELGPDNNYLSEPHNVVDSESKNEYISAPQNVIGYLRSNKPSSKVADHSQPARTSQESQLQSDAKLGSSQNKCLKSEEPVKLAGHSRRSMSSYSDDQNDVARDLFNNAQNNNDPYVESHISNEDAVTSVYNVDKNYNTLKSNREQSLVNLNKLKTATLEKSATWIARPQFTEARRELLEPTRGSGVANMGKNGPIMMQSERVCYACSTANNPTCWSPDRRTTVKYCKKGNNACLTKTFGSGSTFTLIRDCGKSCDDSDMGGLMPRYKSCSMCHSELCNSAYSISGHSVILSLLLIALVKYID